MKNPPKGYCSPQLTPSNYQGEPRRAYYCDGKHSIPPLLFDLDSEVLIFAEGFRLRIWGWNSHTHKVICFFVNLTHPPRPRSNTLSPSTFSNFEIPSCNFPYSTSKNSTAQKETKKKPSKCPYCANHRIIVIMPQSPVINVTHLWIKDKEVLGPLSSDPPL